MTHDWLLITVSTPGGGSSTLRVHVWRTLRRHGAHYLQQSAWVLPSTPKTTRAATRLVTRLRAEGGHGQLLHVQLTKAPQETAIVNAIQREREDEYRELLESTQRFRDELEAARRRSRATDTDLNKSAADLARHQRWLAAIHARDYLHAPGGKAAAAAVASCEEALAHVESEALSAERDESAPDAEPALRASDLDG